MCACEGRVLEDEDNGSIGQQWVKEDKESELISVEMEMRRHKGLGGGCNLGSASKCFTAL